MSKNLLFVLLIFWQSDRIQQTSLIWLPHCLDFHLKLSRFSQEHALNPPQLLLDFLILGYYVQSHVNTFLWHLSCKNSFVCGFKQALIHRQVVQFIQSFQMEKNKFTKQLRTVPRALFIAKERGSKTLSTKFSPQVYLGEHLDLPQVTRRRIWANEFNQDLEICRQF